MSCIQREIFAWERETNGLRLIEVFGKLHGLYTAGAS